MVCKEKAIQLDANDPAGKDVYFLSFLGADEKGFPTPFRFVFDLITMWYDFGNTNVKFIDVQTLCDHYEKKTGKKSSGVNVYKLALQFMADHPNSHYIMDEVPFLRNVGLSKNSFINKN